MDVWPAIFASVHASQNSEADSLFISSRGKSAIFLHDSKARTPKRYHSQLFHAFSSNVAFAQGSNRPSQNDRSDGIAFFSRMPTRPTAREVLCALSILRATLSLRCFADSQIKRLAGSDGQWDRENSARDTA